MLLYAKAASTAEEIREKLNRGAEGIEIQLLSADDPFYKNRWCERIKGEGLLDYIRAVHLPLSGAYGNCPIETPHGLYMLKTTCMFAREIAEQTGNRINIICHYSSSKIILEEMGLYRKLTDDIGQIGRYISEVELCIENTPYDYLHWDNDNATLVKDIGVPSVRTCVDTCHALMTEKIREKMEGLTGIPPITVEETFRANSGICSHIHLAGAEDTGTGYGRDSGHGTPFRGQNDSSLVRSLRLIKEHAPYAQVVLEVREDNYLDCTNYTKARKNVRSALERL